MNPFQGSNNLGGSSFNFNSTLSQKPNQVQPIFGQTGAPDTTNLGYQAPGQNGATWNDYYANGQNPAGGVAGGLNLGQASGSSNVGGNSPYDIQNLISMQMQQNNQARQQNQANWNGASGYLKGIPDQYNQLASTQGAQSLTNQLASNPLSLSPGVVAQMKNTTANQIQAQGDNAFKQTQGILAAGGQTDASSLAAAQEAQNRQNMGAQQTQNTAIDIEAAKQRTQDLANAAGVAQRQSAQDIGVPMNVGNSIISHLPQVKPDDYSGLLALTNQMQNQQFQNSLLQNSNIRTPIASSPIGGKYSANTGGSLDNFGYDPATATGPGVRSGSGGPNTSGMIDRSKAYTSSNGGDEDENNGGLKPFGNTGF